MISIIVIKRCTTFFGQGPKCYFFHLKFLLIIGYNNILWRPLDSPSQNMGVMTPNSPKMLQLGLILLHEVSFFFRLFSCCSLWTKLCLQWEPEVISVALM